MNFFFLMVCELCVQIIYSSTYMRLTDYSIGTVKSSQDFSHTIQLE